MSVKMNHKNLRVYKEAKELVILVYQLLRKFPHEEQYALCDQLRRAVISIPSNIAEGMGRVSHKEQIHFLEIAFGSLMEVGAQMDVATDLGYISAQELELTELKIDALAAMLSGLRKVRLENGDSKAIKGEGAENTPAHRSPLTANRYPKTDNRYKKSANRSPLTANRYQK